MRRLAYSLIALLSAAPAYAYVAPPADPWGTPFFSLYSSTPSPIISSETQNTVQSGGSYFGQPYTIGFNATAGSPIYASMETAKLAVTGTPSAHWGLKEITIDLSGSGTLSGELNEEKALVTVPSGTALTGGGENYEAKLSNGGAVNSWAGFLSVPQNLSTGTMSGTLYGFNSIYSNNSSTALSLVVDYGCGSNGGTGAVASFHYCIFNSDPKADIINEGHWNTRNNNAPTMSAGCGTGAALAAGSSDAAGTVTIGTSPGGTCVLTFGRAYVTNAPFVVLSSPTASAMIAYSTSTTALTLTSPVVSTSFTYLVMGSH